MRPAGHRQMSLNICQGSVYLQPFHLSGQLETRNRDWIRFFPIRLARVPFDLIPPKRTGLCTTDGVQGLAAEHERSPATVAKRRPPSSNLGISMTISGNYLVPESVRVVLLPGLGTDGRMFDPQRAVFPRLQTPTWIVHCEAESLADYARRMASAVKAHGHFYLGGASFGGMVALEMARHLRPEAVFLIGSCRSGQQVPWYLRCWEPAGRLIPDAAVHLVRRMPVRIWAMLLQADPRRADLVREIMSNASIPFFRWAQRAMARWKGAPRLASPVHQIHGRLERILPVQRVRPDFVVAGAGHLLSMSHPGEVNAFIRARVHESSGHPRRA